MMKRMTKIRQKLCSHKYTTCYSIPSINTAVYICGKCKHVLFKPMK